MISELKHPKRERERAGRESRESELDRTRSHHCPNPSSHWSCRTPALLRSRRQDRTPDRNAKIALLPPPSRLNSRRLNLDAPHANAGLRSPLTLRSPSHLYNTRSTSLQTHLPILLFSFSYVDTNPRSRCRDCHPWPTHDWSFSFSIYLSLSLNFWSLSLPPSLSLTKLFEFNEWFCFDFCFFKFIYWNFLL